MSTTIYPNTGQLYYSGVLAIIASFIILILALPAHSTFGIFPTGSFMINFSFTATFFTALLFSGRLKRGRNGMHLLMLLLILLLISAYALNRDIPIFDTTADWFAIVLIASCLNFILLGFSSKLPVSVLNISCLVAGVSMIAFFYLAIYLLPLYGFSAVVLPALGLSAHTFVPLLICIYIVRLIKNVSAENKRLRKFFIAGTCIATLSVIFYCVYWNSHLEQINREVSKASTIKSQKLPSWIHIASNIPLDKTTERILRTGLSYSVYEAEGADFFWSTPDFNMETKIHDPLVMISSFFCVGVNLSREDRVRILETNYNLRHEGQDRLWSGTDLVTSDVITRVELIPEFRLAHSQLEITVTNTSKEKWSDSQEAIYTFHLPEGSVATALSLWIEGKEEKSILTTKAKADSAYQTIVGKERRDPSVLHWQEGNTISVRVFPVVHGESRKFKIGVTSPLATRDNQLEYQNIYFDGPSFTDCRSTIAIGSTSPLNKAVFPSDFRLTNNQIIANSVTYEAKWSVIFAAPPISKQTFNFNGSSYSVEPTTQTSYNFTPTNVYLDINKSWSEDQFLHVLTLLGNKKVYAFTGANTLARITSQNAGELFEKLRRQNFTLFPFQQMNDTGGSLVITRSSSLSPTVDELRGSEFLNEAALFFTDKPPVRMFVLGDDLSPYLKTLKELRLIECQFGNENDLVQILASKEFRKPSESNNLAAIQHSGISIRKNATTATGSAPDYLMRLFSYNRILAEAGGELLRTIPDRPDLVYEAENAFVVSPFSSLVVLETQKDYDRFNIRANSNSLNNAVLKSNGAVPEPHEWALISLVITLSLIMARKRLPNAKLRL